MYRRLRCPASKLRRFREDHDRAPIRGRNLMSFGDILYIIAIFIFVFLTFGIIRNYYKSKFDEDDVRIDMREDEERE